MGELDERDHVEPDLTHLRVEVGSRRTDRRHHPRVVDEQIDRVGAMGQARRDPLDAVGGDQVGDEHLGLHAVVCRELGRERDSRRRSSRATSTTSLPRVGELPRELTAEAG